MLYSKTVTWDGVDARGIVQDLGLSGMPVGLGGCENDGRPRDCCEYNLTVFDGGSGESVREVAGKHVKLHHCRLEESDANVLVQLGGLKVLQDDQWRLTMFLAGLRERKKAILRSFAKGCLVEAGIFANRAREAAISGDPFGGVWVKCSSYFLADAIFAINERRPSPSHMMEIARGMGKNAVNESFSLVYDMLGIERASTSVLERMAKSTMGFSDMVEKNGSSAIVARKYEYMAANSLLSDCYYYLGYVNRDNIMRLRNTIHKRPEYIHVLKVGLDIENDPLIVAKQGGSLLQRVNELLGGTAENG
ncbi:MAG: hypothetical protein KGI33_05545 [Thaumarchaeota archaeon]|nr:hypothetical protein [Nitrososphaerota archaeon]